MNRRFIRISNGKYQKSPNKSKKRQNQIGTFVVSSMDHSNLLFMKNPTLVFTAAREVAVQDRPLPELSSDEAVRIRTETSILSAGTELACLRGTEFWAPFPFVPGYGSVGTVEAVGAAVTAFAPGDRVFTYGRHEAYSLANTVTTKIPADLAGEEAVFARMAAVAVTALRVSDVSFGDPVAVLGLGLVGNLAAQIFTLAGCEVIGVDLDETRRTIAGKCGIAHTLAPGDDLREAITELTAGRKCRSVVDATGVPAVIAGAPALAGPGGELILLGSPRGVYETDLVPFLNYSHLAGFGNITIKGAHEYLLPVSRSLTRAPLGAEFRGPRPSPPRAHPQGRPSHAGAAHAPPPPERGAGRV